MRLLRAGTERSLTAGRLEAVRLQDTLQRLHRRATAAATGRHLSSHGRHDRVSGGRGHFVLRVRQTFRMNARTKKMEPVSVGVIVGIAIVGGIMLYAYIRGKAMPLPPVPSPEEVGDPTPVGVSE